MAKARSPGRLNVAGGGGLRDEEDERQGRDPKEDQDEGGCKERGVGREVELGYAGGTWEKWAPGKTRFGRRNGGIRESTDLEGLQDRRRGQRRRGGDSN